MEDAPTKAVLLTGQFEVILNTKFQLTIKNTTPQSVSATDEVEAAYTKLHHMGYAHSVECWQDETLVGGLYGVAIGGAFFGESMFSHVRDASKVALVHLVIE